MMKKPVIITILMLQAIWYGCSTQQVVSTINDAIEVANGSSEGVAPLTNSEVTSGLKEALIKGITNGVKDASATDGYFGNELLKIPFPKDAQKVEKKLRDIGLGGEVDKFIKQLNRGAEQAAIEAKPIFINAITSMTIEDAFGILKGDSVAATSFLRRTTEKQLVQAFTPKMDEALQQVNATKYYGDLVNTYNKIPFIEKVNPDLTAFATQKAIDGLFLLVAKEEQAIRKDPIKRTTELLQRVFGSLDK